MPFMIVALMQFAAFKGAEAETDDSRLNRLAEMFSPILILTEETGGQWGDIIVTKPEPVGIMGATSADSIWFDIWSYPGLVDSFGLDISGRSFHLFS